MGKKTEELLNISPLPVKTKESVNIINDIKYNHDNFTCKEYEYFVGKILGFPSERDDIGCITEKYKSRQYKRKQGISGKTGKPPQERKSLADHLPGFNIYWHHCPGHLAFQHHQFCLRLCGNPGCDPS